MVILIAAIVVAQAQLSLFKQVVPTPTGQNGYEDYVQAASMLTDPTAGALMAGPVAASDSPEGPRAALVGKSRLDIEQMLWSRYAKAIDLVERGNGKPVFSPRGKLTVDTTFPELAGFKSIGRLAIAGAHVLLANGSPRAATRVLLTVLTMSSRIEGQLVIGHLVGIAIRAIILGAIDENLDRFDDASWVEIGRAASNLLDPSISLDATFQSERELSDQALEAMVDAKPDGSADSGDQENALPKLTKGYTRERWEHVLFVVRSVIKQRQDAVLAIMKRPEREWQLEPIVFDDPVVEALVDTMTPVYNGMLSADAKSRTQLRLLRLHAAIQQYRWHTGKLPQKLTDLVPDVEDPLTGEPFVYEPGGRGRYELYSKGSASTGRIDLKYIRLNSKSGVDGAGAP